MARTNFKMVWILWNNQYVTLSKKNTEMHSSQNRDFNKAQKTETVPVHREIWLDYNLPNSTIIWEISKSPDP